jgi:hypothetical protein
MEPQYHRSSNTGGSRHYYYCPDEDEDFSAEELFNIFFGHSGMISTKSNNKQYIFSII